MILLYYKFALNLSLRAQRMLTAAVSGTLTLGTLWIFYAFCAGFLPAHDRVAFRVLLLLCTQVSAAAGALALVAALMLPKVRVRAWIAGMALLLALAETALAAGIHIPGTIRLFPPTAQELLVLLYGEHWRRNIQMEKESGEYDPEFAYRLKPGSFVFSNTEYITRYWVNSRGFRDDESSLVAPEIIVLGDSQAMGWGVEQEETFAQILERETGLKTLNTGVSSYGTAREMKVLSKLDLSKARFIVIQYSENDLRENYAYAKNRYRYHPPNPEKFENLKSEYRKLRTYYPGRYLAETIRRGVRNAIGAEKAKTLPRLNRDGRKREQHFFLDALASQAHLLEGRKVFAFLIQYPRTNRRFKERVERALSPGRYPAPVQAITILDFEAKLRPEHFFPLDRHLNAEGHRLIARAIRDEIL